jgi:single-strand DNA-binding protein
VNKCIFVGRLGRDPEVRYTPSSQAIAGFSLAIDESYKDREGNKVERTLWVDCVAWGKTAELCGKYLQKGRQVLIEGRLQIREYEAKDGSGKRRRAEIVADRVEFIGNRPDSGQRQPGDEGTDRAAAATGPADDEDIPFVCAWDISSERRFRI